MPVTSRTGDLMLLVIAIQLLFWYFSAACFCFRLQKKSAKFLLINRLNGVFER